MAVPVSGLSLVTVRKPGLDTVGKAIFGSLGKVLAWLPHTP